MIKTPAGHWNLPVQRDLRMGQVEDPHQMFSIRGMPMMW